MTRRLALALLAGVGLALLLVGPGASAVTYPQAGYDGGRTGAVPFDLPRANDTAFELELPGTPTGTVAVDGSTAYVVTLDHGFEVDNETLDANALWSIDLDTAEVTKRFEIFDERPDWSTAFTDGERVYTQVERTVAAHALHGEELWSWEVPSFLPGAEHVACFDDPAFQGDAMYLACIELRPRQADGPTGRQETEEVPQTNLLVAKLDADTGGTHWVWNQTPDRNPNTDFIAEEQVPAETVDVLNAEVTATEDRVLLHAFAYGRDRAYMLEGGEEVGGETGSETYTRQLILWGLGAETGRFRIHEVTEQAQVQAGPGFEFDAGWEIALDGKPTATASRGFLHWVSTGGLWSFNPLNGQDRWTAELATAGDLERMGNPAVGVRDDTVVAASDRALTRLDDATTDARWETLLPPHEPITYGTSPLVLGAERAVVETLWHEADAVGNPSLNRSGSGLRAVDLDNGDVLWDHGLYTTTGPPGSVFVEPPPAFETQGFWGSSPGFAPGVIVAPRLDGHVEVLGDTGVSMGGPDVDTERFPAVGENVTVDLSDTEPGAFGEASRYRVEWGDGAATPWREDPVFTHAYEEEGNVTARVFAGNDENQTTSTFVTMRVGQTEPNFVETAFKQENQDMTFGVLGVALALGGGLVGVGRRYRKRSNLQDELEALEEGFEGTKHSPGECEAFLDERKARARSLALDGYLREDQVGVVENRAEELRARLRTGALEEEFGFLPHSLVVKAREMVQDGQVTRLEREAFLRALEEDEILTSQQKTQVRERIEAWFARDAGGGGLPRGEEMDDA